MQQKPLLYLIIFIVAVSIVAGIMVVVVGPPVSAPDQNAGIPPITSGSSESRQQEEPVIAVATPHTAARSGEQLAVIWVVSERAGDVASHAAIHWGTASMPGKLGPEVAPADVPYTSLTPEFAQGGFPLPDDFTAHVTFPEPGTYYYRAHAIVGGSNYWTDEYVIIVE